LASPVLSHRSVLRRESHHPTEISETDISMGQTEQIVQNIAAMFPTVDESHIRDLLKK
jgi:hypothetical protein